MSLSLWKNIDTVKGCTSFVHEEPCSIAEGPGGKKGTVCSVIEQQIWKLSACILGTHRRIDFFSIFISGHLLEAFFVFF